MPIVEIDMKSYTYLHVSDDFDSVLQLYKTDNVAATQFAGIPIFRQHEFRDAPISCKETSQLN